MTVDAPTSERPLAGRVGIVTGASRGIGAAIARALARAGAHLTLAARSEEALDKLATELTDEHDTGSLVVPTDVTDPSSVRAMVARTVERFGRLDLAVNNAGGGFTGKVAVGELDEREFEAMVRLNLHSVQWSLAAEIPAMVASGGGTIVNMSSGSGQHAASGMGAYVAAKHGLEGLTKTAALDHARDGIRINALAPGSVLAGPLAHAPAEFRQQAADACPLGRIAGPDEIANAALWLCTDAASYVTGAVIPIDGGQSAGYHSP